VEAWEINNLDDMRSEQMANQRDMSEMALQQQGIDQSDESMIEGYQAFA
jgi:hypothetical protein